LARLPRDRGDQVEVGVVVQHRVPGLFGCGRDQEIWDLATPLTDGCQHALYLARSVDVHGTRFHEFEGVQGRSEIVPFGGVAGRVPDLEVADTSAVGAARREQAGVDRSLGAEMRARVQSPQNGWVTEAITPISPAPSAYRQRFATSPT
jgi:hypothetical protein